MRSRSPPPRTPAPAAGRRPGGAACRRVRRRGRRPSSGPSAKIRAVIDLHTHVLPGIDDGPEELAGSVAVAEVAAHGGIRTLVATPHLRADHPRVRPGELRERARALERHLRAQGLPLEIVPGAEVDLDAAGALAD